MFPTLQSNQVLEKFHTQAGGRQPVAESQKADPSFEIGLRERGLGERKLDLASWTSCKFAHLHHQARALHGIELEDELRNLGDKRIADQ